ncbi:hypothetical protein GQ53DRAFT_362874 [Thozetella sp. PMI_491]|nr:hypothetical protein GQ53DRAFT_362874 [Thozetella sp. PMI_491]
MTCVAALQAPVATTFPPRGSFSCLSVVPGTLPSLSAQTAAPTSKPAYRPSLRCLILVPSRHPRNAPPPATSPCVSSPPRRLAKPRPPSPLDPAWPVGQIAASAPLRAVCCPSDRRSGEPARLDRDPHLRPIRETATSRRHSPPLSHYDCIPCDSRSDRCSTCSYPTIVVVALSPPLTPSHPHSHPHPNPSYPPHAPPPPPPPPPLRACSPGLSGLSARLPARAPALSG